MIEFPGVWWKLRAAEAYRVAYETGCHWKEVAVVVVAAAVVVAVVVVVVVVVVVCLRA